MGRPFVNMSSQLHLPPAKMFLCGYHSQTFHSLTGSIFESYRGINCPFAYTNVHFPVSD